MTDKNRVNSKLISNQLSIIVPAYNESKTIHLILDKIKNATLINNIQKEIIIVNDCSTDDTGECIKKYIEDNSDLEVKYFEHKINMGKGAALRTGIQNATGEYLIVQDADLEYDPNEYNLLLKPILDGHADVVYGSRFMGGKPHRILFFLAYHRKQVPYFSLQHVYQFESYGYGNLL